MNDFKRILVTGGAGFIGSHLVERLAKSRYEVTTLDNFSTGKLGNIQDSITTNRARFVVGDILDSGIIEKCVDKTDAVFHLAAVTSVPWSVENPVLTFKTNAEGTVRLLNACAKAKVRKFVFISSCAVYGEPRYLPIDEKHFTRPISPYAVSKLKAEGHCADFREKDGMKTVTLRLFNVYGPRQASNEYSGVITKFIERARQRLPLVVYGDGTQTRDFVHVYDVAHVLVRVLEDENSENQVFNIGFGRPVSVNELAKNVLNLAGVDSGIAYEKSRTGDLKHSLADISKARKLLGYDPKVRLEDGLRTV